MGGLSFVHPALLWGALLAALPLIIHLFHRKRAKPHPFAAIDFVLRSRRRTARRLRLRRLLLFAVRTLLLLAIPVALARPYRARPAEAATPRGPAATAIVLDTSLSMSYRHDGRPLLERAREMARDALGALSPEDPVTLVPCERDAAPPASPGFDRGRVREAIQAAQPAYLPEDLTACLSRAARALGESPLPAKRIVLATDLTAAAFRLDVPAPTVPTAQGEVRPEVVLLDAAGGAEELPNLAVSGLRVEPAPSVGHRAYQLTVTVANHARAQAKDVKVAVRVGTEVVAKGFVDVPARATAVKSLTYRFPAGGVYTGAVEIAPDALGADDARHFALKVPRDVRALVVNGAPHPVRFLDEAFFVQAALDAPGSPVRPTLRDAETAAAERFADYDVVLLLNVRELPRPKIAELAAFVQAGGGLFVSVGDQVQAEAYNEAFGELLPRALHLVKTAADRNKEGEGERKPARLAQLAFDHPALSVFTGEAREGFLSAQTYRYFLLSPSGEGPVTQLATYDDGAPALLEGRRGRGRVLLYTSTVDRDWSDWAIRTSFLPAMQRLAGWLAGVLDEQELAQIRVGEPKPLEPPADVQGLAFKAPDGRDVAPVVLPDGRPAVTATGLPGVYLASGRRQGAAAELPELHFAANVDPAESDLTRLDERELKAYFGEKTRTERVSGREEAPPPVPFWSVLLAAAVGLFFAEGLLLRKA